MGSSFDAARLDNCCHMPSAGVLQRQLPRGMALLDFCVPVNSYFPTADMFAHLHRELDSALKFYPDCNESIAEMVAANLDLDPRCLVMGNGSTELIAWITQIWKVERLMTPVPTFGRWTDYPRDNGVSVQFHHRREEDDFQLDVDRLIDETRALGCKGLAICNPNNPTGRLTAPSDLRRLFDELSDLDFIVIDESFLDFAASGELPTVSHEVQSRPNLIVLKSLGKNFGLHGMRAGFAVTNSRSAARLAKAVPAWNVNVVAELVLRAAAEEADSYQNSRIATLRDREYLIQSLHKIDALKLFQSEANFVYAKLREEFDGVAVRNRLLNEHGILIRECGSKVGATSQYFRIAARPQLDTDRLTLAFSQVLLAESSGGLN